MEKSKCLSLQLLFDEGDNYINSFVVAPFMELGSKVAEPSSKIPRSMRGDASSSFSPALSDPDIGIGHRSPMIASGRPILKISGEKHVPLVFSLFCCQMKWIRLNIEIRRDHKETQEICRSSYPRTLTDSPLLPPQGKEEGDGCSPSRFTSKSDLSPVGINCFFH